MLTPQLAAKLPAIALDVKYMFTDDVYVGILVSQVDDANVIIEDMIGEHTEQSLDKFLWSFRNEGRIFYHVPSIKHFISWYYLDNDLIRYDPPPRKKRLPFSQQTHSTVSSSIFLAIMFILFIFILVLFLVLVCASSNFCDNLSPS